LLLLVFLMITILARVKWNLKVVFIFISFLARDVKNFFMWLLDICTFSFENYLLSSLAHLFIGLLIPWEFSFWAPYKFYFLILCQIYSWQKFYPILLVFLFSQVTISFARQRLLSFIQSHLSILSLIHLAIGVLFRKLLTIFTCFGVFHIISYTSFKVSGLTLRFLTDFELILV
jgi:hypothetical protein